MRRKTKHQRRAAMRQTPVRQIRPCRGIDDNKAERVLLALKRAVDGGAVPADPIVEQLKQCPEAFKVGEILGKAFDSLKYDGDGEVLSHRYLPPSGVVIPPFA